MRIPTLGPGPGSNLGNKWQSIAQVVKNADTVTIPAGTPVILAANATEDGVGVLLPSTAAAANSNATPDLFVGILGNSCAVGAFQDAVCYGLVTNARLILQTRAASTAIFASYPAVSVGDALTIETINNGLSRSASGGSGLLQSPFVAMQSFASSTSIASSVTNPGPTGALTSVSALYMPFKVYVRGM